MIFLKCAKDMRLQSMAVFDEISGAQKAQILGAGALNSCQVRIMGELKAKVTEYVYNLGQIESGKMKVVWLMPNKHNLHMANKT